MILIRSLCFRYAAKRYEWVRCDPAALVEIWTGAATGKTVGGRGGGPANACLGLKPRTPLSVSQIHAESLRILKLSFWSGQSWRLTDHRSGGGAEVGPPLACSSFMQVPQTLKLSFPHQAHTARPMTYMQIDSASEIGTSASAPAKRPNLGCRGFFCYL